MNMSDVTDKLEKEFEPLTGNFVILLDAEAKNYFEAVMETLALMLKKKKKGVYVTASRPYKFISNEVRKRGLNTGDILFIDCVSVMFGECGDKACTYVENPAALEKISMRINYLLNKIDSPEKFLIIDSVPNFLSYTSTNSVTEFLIFLIKKLRRDDLSGVLVLIKKESPENLKQVLTEMSDKTITV